MEIQGIRPKFKANCTRAENLPSQDGSYGSMATQPVHPHKRVIKARVHGIDSLIVERSLVT